METTLSPEIVNIMKNRNKNMKRELYCTHKENDLLKQENKYMKQTQTLPQHTHKEKELLKQENKLFHIQHNIIQHNNEKRLLKQEIQQQQANKIVSILLLKWNKRNKANKLLHIQENKLLCEQHNNKKNFWNKWYKSNDSTLQTS